MSKNKKITGVMVASSKKIAIIIASFNKSITQLLLDGAKEAIVKHGGSLEHCLEVWVPGSFELAATAKHIDNQKKYDAIICLGAVIKGETDHYQFVAGNTASGIANVASNGTVPIIFGVLTTDTIEQAQNRAGLKAGNIGYDAALAAIEMISVYEQIKKL